MSNDAEASTSRFQGSDDLDSEVGYDSEVEKRRKRRYDLTEKFKVPEPPKRPTKGEGLEALHKERRTGQSFHQSLDAYSRHKKLMNDYFLIAPGDRKRVFQRDKSKDRTDFDVIRDNHQFLWEEGEELNSWEKQLAKKYYEKLFKEYCVSDLSKYKEKKIAMRWRIEKEVVSGKGQFICGEKSCENRENLTSWEINFAYVELGQKKNALVKLRLCPNCSKKLNYYHPKNKAVKKIAKISTDSEVLKNFQVKKEQGPDFGAGPSEPSEKIAEISAKEESQMWSKAPEIDQEKSRDQEIDEYLQDLFM